ncbi:DUF3054 domain-containing protein [Leucobacter chromiireducens subsp. chromiireducens]|uniref:DUF3054 domain-containing protein n=1 Tax=Leucobacter chromiireducens subsp. chromiireducens TaxID=660067 RepID=A0ABS1SNT4_9MICO|nr:DUF3054 domain-containing protein [Leucobacter chromiireducens subsp. chromiireducens]
MALRALPALVLDVALVLLFAGLGRGSHAREATLIGLLETAWPFLAALALSWILCGAARRPIALLRTGLPVWLGTVAVGMLVRWLSGGGVALAFVLVTLGTLGVFLLGWRLIAMLIVRLRRRSA